MEHKSLEEIGRIAEVQPDLGQRNKMSKRERMERWAQVLERQEGRRLRSLERTESATGHQHDAMREDDSPLTVAFEDPVLRSEGLQSDRLGDAIEFFGLSNRQAHDIVCYCHYGRTMSPKEAAYSVRAIAARAERYTLYSPRNIVMGVAAGAAVAFAVSVL